MRLRGIRKKRTYHLKRNPRRIDEDKFWAQKRAIAHELFMLQSQGYEIWQLDEVAFNSTDYQRTAWAPSGKNL